MKRKGKKYDIDTLGKFLNVINEDNFDRVMVDFATNVGIYLQICKNIRRNDPEGTKGKANSDLAEFKSFTWIDDGKVGIKEIILTDNKTGEVLSVQNKTKRQKIKDV